MNDPHETILERHFFEFIDRGESLSHLIARQFQLSQHEAEAAIEVARREVSL
jgi:hypothetical protein